MYVKQTGRLVIFRMLTPVLPHGLIHLNLVVRVFGAMCETCVAELKIPAFSTAVQLSTSACVICVILRFVIMVRFMMMLIRRMVSVSFMLGDVAVRDVSEFSMVTQSNLC